MGFVLTLHAIWRWLVLIVSVLVVIKAAAGWLGKQRWTQLDDRLGLIITILVDLQFLLGLLLWLFGPINVGMLSGSMGNAVLRFLLLEHGVLFLLALVFAHIGRSRSKRAPQDVAKHRNAFIFYLLSFIFTALIFIMRSTGMG